jgi:hypothetical protein
VAKDPFSGPNAEFRNTAANLNTKVLATPLVYGISVPQSVSLNADFLAFDGAYQATIDPETRTPGKVQLMHDTRATLKSNLRMIAGIIQKNPAVTNEQRVDLGLPVYAERSPISAPPDAPVAEVAEMNGWTAKIKTRPAGSEGRSTFAAGAIQLAIYSYVGATPPGNVNAYKYEGVSSRAIFEVNFDPDLAVGTKVFVCCCWQTARGLTSPACTPIPLLIGGGVPEVMAS